MQMQSTPIAVAVQRQATLTTGIAEAEQQRNLMCTNASGQENYTSQRAETSLMNMTGGVKEIGKIMPDFNPSKATSSKAFIDRINQLRAAYGWSDQMVLYAIHDKLKGPAKQWIDAMPVFSTWEGFVQAFSIDFPSDINQAEINMQMMRSRIGRSESYVDYFYRMLALGRSGSLSDDSIITYIINGIYDVTVKTILSTMQFGRCADLLKALTNLPTNEKRFPEPTALKQSKNANAPPGSTQQGVASRQYDRNKDGSWNMSGLTCYRCRERGHVARDCKKPRESTNKINCTENIEPSEAVDGNVYNINLNDNCKEMLVKIVIMTKTPVTCKALIDSGSSKSLVKRSIAEGLGLRKLACNEKLVGFAGGEVICTEKITTMVQFDDVAYAAELLIIDDDKLCYEVLIGIDVLKQATLIIDKGVCRVMPVGVVNLDVNRSLPHQTARRNVVNEYDWRS